MSSTNMLLERFEFIPSIVFIISAFFQVQVTPVTCRGVNQRPVPPHPPHYNGVQPFSNITPITCSAKETAYTGPAPMNGVIDSKYRWTSFNLYLDDAYDLKERSNINDAMWTLSQLIPCVPFGIWPPYSTPTGDYVYVIKGRSNGCSSYAGRQGGSQAVCTFGTITHELLHALGFHHEHGRPDRDDYIDIQWENVEPGLEHAFQKYSSGTVTSFDVPYNIHSIMHYDNHAFSKDGQPNGNGSEIMGSLEMQETDIDKLQRMYNCSATEDDEEEEE